MYYSAATLLATPILRLFADDVLAFPYFWAMEVEIDRSYINLHLIDLDYLFK